MKIRVSNGIFSNDGCYHFCHNFSCKSNYGGNYHNCASPEHCYKPCSQSAGCKGIGCPKNKIGSYEIDMVKLNNKEIDKFIESLERENIFYKKSIKRLEQISDKEVYHEKELNTLKSKLDNNLQTINKLKNNNNIRK